MTRVVNKYKESYDVFIGRGSVWGNPFSHKLGTKAEFVVDSRDEAVAQYKRYLWVKLKDGTITEEMLLALEGKTLGCYCKPQACHGDVLVAAINWIRSRQ